MRYSFLRQQQQQREGSIFSTDKTWADSLQASTGKGKVIRFSPTHSISIGKQSRVYIPISDVPEEVLNAVSRIMNCAISHGAKSQVNLMPVSNHWLRINNGVRMTVAYTIYIHIDARTIKIDFATYDSDDNGPDLMMVASVEHEGYTIRRRSTKAVIDWLTQQFQHSVVLKDGTIN